MSAEIGITTQGNGAWREHPATLAHVNEQRGITLQKLPSDRLVVGNELQSEAAKLKPHLEGLTLKSKIKVIHDWFEPQLQASGIQNYCDDDSSHDESFLHPVVREAVKALTRGELQLRNSIGSATEHGKFKPIEQRLQDADELFVQRGEEFQQALEGVYGQPIDKKILRAALRLRGGKTRMTTDYDGTLTNDKLVMREMNGLVDPTLLGSGLGDPLHGDDRIHFKQVFAAVWRPLLLAFPEIFEEGGESVPFRDGVGELLQYAIEEGLHPVVDTTNFTPFPQAGLAKLAKESGLFNVSDIPVHAVNTDGLYGLNAALKGDIIKKAALDDNAVVFHLADSHSDGPALQAKNVIAFYIALKDGKFATDLEREEVNDPQLLHFEFRDGFEALAILQEIFFMRDLVDRYIMEESKPMRGRRYATQFASPAI